MFGYAYPHKICDPVHGFIRFDDLERKLINSAPFQRLRHIRQMGVSFLVYPGAQHTRFEHSLGVMELASRLFDTLLNPHFLRRDLLIESIPSSEEELFYWRRILRFAALCHDLGHLPFSHTAEKVLLGEGGHEEVTLKCIQSSFLRPLWQECGGKKAEEDILKLSIGEEDLKSMGCSFTLSPWEKMLSQVITDDNFGADRIDYLIRDAKATGVGYGHFDYHQLIDCLRILPDSQNNCPLTIGIAENGLQSVESLWIARYLMYARVYHHPRSRIYSFHLCRFMRRFYEKNGFPADLKAYLDQMDFTILQALVEAAKEGDLDALILLKREKEYKEISLNSISDIKQLTQKLDKKFPLQYFLDDFTPHGEFCPEKLRHFSILTEEGKVTSSVEKSAFLREIPLSTALRRLYISPEIEEHIALL